ncbi:MAG TPA: GGDEF domain-containing protein [Candidatus Atribacteria bacterium]|nr:GGDEF domain-containing protein [Candidatus Atribacteria bacterium]
MWNTRGKVIISFLVFCISLLSIGLFDHLYDTTKIACKNCVFIKRGRFEGKELQIPFFFESPGTNVFEFNFGKVKCDTPALFIPLIDGNYLAVYLNGHLVGASGNPISSNSLRWNKPELFIIPKSLFNEDINELKILLKTENTTGIFSPLYLGDLKCVRTRYILLSFLNLMLNQFYIVTLLVFGFFMILLPFLIDLRRHRAIIGLSLILFAIYLIDYTYVPFLPLPYAIYKKIVLSSLYISLALYALGFAYEFEFRDFHLKIAFLLLIANIILSFILFSVPNNSVVVRRTYLKTNITIYLCMIFMVSIFMRKVLQSGKTEKILIVNLNAIVFLLPYVFVDVYVLVRNLPKPVFTQYALPILVFTNTLYIVNDFVTLYRRLILEKRRAKFLEMESMRDPLTGALNRRFINKISEIIPELYSVSIIDVDGFKEFNDRFGHMLGDCILKKLTATFKSMLRRDDYVVRYGGDEFLILLYKTSGKEAEKILEKIKNKVREDKVKCDNQEFSVSFSYGIASMGEANTFEDLLRLADSRLYEAKSLKPGI